jgi:subtilisin family serine protease
MNNKCSLFPYVREEVLSLQDAAQKAGWNITAFDLPSTWKKTRGEGVKIGVLDTGCDLDHPDLKSNLLPGINFVNPSSDPWDDNSHGTHVSGIIAAENNDIGMVGVAPAAKIVPIKVLDRQGNGSLSDVAQGIRWAVDVGGVDLICMSLGSASPVQEVRNSIKYAQSKGVVCFVAAGNAGLTKSIFYPANYPETIAIGSIDENLGRSSFSNTGENLDFMAPGNKIFSTVPDNWYAVLSGTSMAAPFAVGVGALLLSHARMRGEDSKFKTSEGYMEEIRKHTMPVANLNLEDRRFYEGFGIIDAKKLIESL